MNSTFPIFQVISEQEGRLRVRDLIERIMNILGSSYAVPKFWGYITNKMKMEGLKSQNLYKQSSSPKQVQTSDCFHLALSTNEYQKIQF